MEKLTVKSSQSILIFLVCLAISGNTCLAQSDRLQAFQEIQKRYPEVSLPVDDLLSLKKEQTIDATIMNKLMFDFQEENSAKFYVDDTLYNDSFGRIHEEPFDFNTAKRINGKAISYDTTFLIKVYALGKIDFGNNHVGLITRIVGFMTDYIDIYLFEKNTGKSKSSVAAFEAAHARNGFPQEGYEAVYNTSMITEDKKIKWHQVRYGVTTDRIYDVSPDGYFRVIYQKSEGKFEY